MNLEQMQKQLEDIQQMDMSNLTSEQLAEVLNKLSTIMTQSEETLINTTLLEVNQIENNEEDETDNS
jgi:hypothetical protein